MCYPSKTCWKTNNQGGQAISLRSLFFYLLFLLAPSYPQLVVARHEVFLALANEPEAFLASYLAQLPRILRRNFRDGQLKIHPNNGQGLISFTQDHHSLINKLDLHLKELAKGPTHEPLYLTLVIMAHGGLEDVGQGQKKLFLTWGKDGHRKDARWEKLLDDLDWLIHKRGLANRLHLNILLGSCYGGEGVHELQNHPLGKISSMIAFAAATTDRNSVEKEIYFVPQLHHLQFLYRADEFFRNSPGPVTALTGLPSFNRWGTILSQLPTKSQSAYGEHFSWPKYHAATPYLRGNSEGPIAKLLILAKILPFLPQGYQSYPYLMQELSFLTKENTQHHQLLQLLRNEEKFVGTRILQALLANNYEQVANILLELPSSGPDLPWIHPEFIPNYLQELKKMQNLGLAKFSPNLNWALEIYFAPSFTAKIKHLLKNSYFSFSLALDLADRPRSLLTNELLSNFHNFLATNPKYQQWYLQAAEKKFYHYLEEYQTFKEEKLINGLELVLMGLIGAPIPAYQQWAQHTITMMNHNLPSLAKLLESRIQRFFWQVDLAQGNPFDILTKLNMWKIISQDPNALIADLQKLVHQKLDTSLPQHQWFLTKLQERFGQQMQAPAGASNCQSHAQKMSF